jgi:hypothetical protein
MWGYPEFYIPVPGGYGSEHAHLGSFPQHERRDAPPEATAAPAPT